MARAFKPRPNLDAVEAPKQRGLTRETVEEIKREILGVRPVGYKSPPVRTRFKKGQSGNPKGRPKRQPDPETPSFPVDQAILSETERMVPIRENGETKEMKAIEVVHRANFKSAANGSPFAQRIYLESHYRAKRAEEEAIREDHAYWHNYVVVCWQERAEAERNGTEPPARLPHPDDVVFDPGKPVYFIGPANEEEQWRFEKQLALRDLLLMQAGYERRLFFDPDADDIFNTAYRLAMRLNEGFPARGRLDNDKIEDIVHRYFCTSKRALLPRLRRAWREFGIPRRRGAVLPPLAEWEIWAEVLLDFSRYDRDSTRDRYMDRLRLWIGEEAQAKL